MNIADMRNKEMTAIKIAYSEGVNIDVFLEGSFQSGFKGCKKNIYFKWMLLIINESFH